MIATPTLAPSEIEVVGTQNDANSQMTSINDAEASNYNDVVESSDNLVDNRTVAGNFIYPKPGSLFNGKIFTLFFK